MVKIAMELLIDGHITYITIKGRNAKKVAIALQDALEQLGK